VHRARHRTRLQAEQSQRAFSQSAQRRIATIARRRRRGPRRVRLLGMQHDLDARRLHRGKRCHADDSPLARLAPSSPARPHRFRRRRRARDRERRDCRRHEYPYVARRNGQPHRPLPPGAACVLHAQRQAATAISEGAVASGNGGGPDAVTASGARTRRRRERPAELSDHPHERDRVLRAILRIG